MSADLLDLPVPRVASIASVLALASEALARGETPVVATVLARSGSAPSTPGQKLVLTSAGLCAGTVGGGALERRVLEEMVATLARARDAREGPRGATAAPRRLELRLGAELGMCCGGGVELLVETMTPPTQVVVVGAGHVATALVPMLTALGCAVTVCDERDGWADASRFAATSVVCGSPRGASTPSPGRAIALVMTHDHALDQDGIEWALRAGYGFVGGVGSRAKALRTRQRLAAKGFAQDDVDRVRMPLGLALGARAPAEIAVSIAGEVVAWMRGVELSSTDRSATGVGLSKAKRLDATESISTPATMVASVDATMPTAANARRDE